MASEGWLMRLLLIDAPSSGALGHLRVGFLGTLLRRLGKQSMRGERPSQVSAGKERTHHWGAQKAGAPQNSPHIACAVEVRAPPLSPVALPALRLVQYPSRVPYKSKMLTIS